MIEFCPECGNMLRKKSCACGYNELKTDNKKAYLSQIWDPPSPNIIYCRITATSFEKLKSMLSKGVQLEKLKEIKKKVRNHLYSCCNCVYYNEAIFLCKFKNKYLKKDSICKRFEPFENI